MFTPASSYSYRDFEFDAERLYAHWLDLKRCQSPSKLVENFYTLFIDGTDYFDREVATALQRIVTSSWAIQEFHNILNRCCYILLNYWWLQADYQTAASELIALFKIAPVASTNPSVVQQRQLVQRFMQSEQFCMLQRRTQIEQTVGKNDKSERIGDLVNRYPSLYPYCLLQWDGSEDGQQVVKRLQAKKQQEFEDDLLRYTRNWVLQSRYSSPIGSAPTKNPTLLSAAQLERAIQQFAGNAEGNRSYRDSAHQFLLEVGQARSHQAVKSQIYEYLTATIEYSCHPKYGRHHFNQWLEAQLKETFSRSDHVRPNGFLLVQTCGQLVEALIAHPNRPQHLRFLDLINNLGATFTIGLLLKIILLCRTMQTNLDAIKSHLVRRFALMFKHYENQIRSDNEWLVECLDNLTVALTIHCGQEDYAKWAELLRTSTLRLREL